MTFTAIFAILVGIGMIGMWGISYFTKQIPELESEPVRIKFHLAAEFATAITLMVAGIGLFSEQAWAITVYLVAVGMLLYTAIVSPGYFAQKGQWAHVGMFALILILAVASIFTVI